MPIIKDLSAKLLNIDGVVMTNSDDGKELTMKSLIVNALLSPSAEQGLTGEKKASRYKLALRLNGGGEQELTPEEIIDIKDVVGKSYPGALMVGRVFDFLG